MPPMTPHRLLPSCPGVRRTLFVGLLVLAVSVTDPAHADFCAEKLSGYWCDGDTLVLCASESVAAKEDCAHGCHSAPIGEHDYCEPPPGGFCVNKLDGLWCDGDTLVLCADDRVTAEEPCLHGCQSAPVGQHDHCAPPPCVPECGDRVCGDWCDVSCGECGVGALCVDGRCEPDPACDGACGDGDLADVSEPAVAVEVGPETHDATQRDGEAPAETDGGQAEVTVVPKADAGCRGAGGAVPPCLLVLAVGTLWFRPRGPGWGL